ncbi:FAE1/Type III polyketide synthase-like protein-domain-containing protein, partial [Haematococcus lacustris]
MVITCDPHGAFSATLSLCRVFARSGLHPQRTYLPPSLNPRFVGVFPKTGLAEAGVEAQLVLGGALEGLLAKTGLAPRDIDILVTTCSIYCPTPSLASMMINRFKLRADVQSYSLGGMGCSNGVVAVNLVKDLLQARPNSNAVFLTTEVTTPAFYPGHDKHRLVTNTLFRMGAAAMLMSNKAAAWARRAKYQLVFNHRVHIGASDEAFSAIHYSPDDQGINGVYLGKNVVTEASRALTKAMWAVGPYVLTPCQKAEFAANWVRRRLLGPQAVAPYQPRFSGAVQHFLLHAGGAKVLEGLGKALLLSEHDLEPSRAVLRDYGNVSSSTTWYTLSYVETVRGVNKGDKVMQVGVGSGIKCGVNVWKALRDVKEVHEVWEECVTQDQAAAARAARALRQLHVDGAHAGRHLATRGVFLLLLLALLLLLHSLLALDLGQWGAG